VSPNFLEGQFDRFVAIRHASPIEQVADGCAQNGLVIDLSIAERPFGFFIEISDFVSAPRRPDDDSPVY
jgi:hypothetical protein